MSKPRATKKQQGKSVAVKANKKARGQQSKAMSTVRSSRRDSRKCHVSDGSSSKNEREAQTLSHKKARHIVAVEAREEPDKATSDDDDGDSDTQRSDEVTNDTHDSIHIY
jgi:hypothetical protein